MQGPFPGIAVIGRIFFLARHPVLGKRCEKHMTGRSEQPTEFPKVDPYFWAAHVGKDRVEVDGIKRCVVPRETESIIEADACGVVAFVMERQMQERRGRMFPRNVLSAPTDSRETDIHADVLRCGLLAKGMQSYSEPPRPAPDVEHALIGSAMKCMSNPFGFLLRRIKVCSIVDEAPSTGA